MEIEDLKQSVTNRLMSEHDMLVDEAEEAVTNSFSNNPSIWNENAAPEDLANLLASDEDDE